VLCLHSVTIANDCDNQVTKKKDLIWLTVLEVLVHAWLTLGNMWQSKATYLMVKKQK
jgi:hypothetical protein